MVRAVKGHVKQSVWRSKNPRALAAEVLRRLEAEPEARASELLDGALGGLPDVRDRGLATELTYGVARWQRRLDAALDAWMPRGVVAVEPMARALLRVGAYQLRMLDRIPKEIAVSATQDAAREAGFARLTGLLNAVLRKVAASEERLPAGDGDAALGVRASLPNWVVHELVAAYGAGAEKEALALRERPLLMLRPTLGKGGAGALLAALGAAGIEAREVGGVIEVAGGDPFRVQAADGLFVAQDGSGLRVIDEVRLACGGELAGKRVLDLCAGRGVKTTALLDRGAQVVAVDVSQKKLDELERVARRLGVERGLEKSVALDAATADLTGLGSFDAVLVDAPCTGLGTLRRHPEIAWRREPRDVAQLAALQQRLVSAGAASVAVGGGVVYAVCTFVRAEAAVSLPSAFEGLARLDLAPSSGLDAFQVVRWVRRDA